MIPVLEWYSIAVVILLAARSIETNEGCPSQESILPCRCLARGDEFQIWCSHSNLQKVLEGLHVVGQHIPRPIDELILENNNLPSMPGKAFLPLRVMRLMLRYNGLERVSSDWLSGQEKSLMELFIVEPELRGLPENSLSHLATLEAVTIQSNLLKHLPNFSRLPKLRHLQVESLSLVELLPRDFKNLPVLEKIHISGSPRLTRLEDGLLQDLPLLSLVNISYCGINWMHPRAITRLPILTELSLVGNRITDAGMVGRASRELPSLSTLRLDYNNIDKLGEAAFVDLPALKKLYISHNKITELHHGAFHRVPMLRVLDLNNNLVRRVHPESFLQHSGSGLEELWLVENDISHVAELRSLLDALPRLTFLDMSRNNLEAIPFGALRGHPTLEQLHLDYNKIHLVDKEAFMAMPALRELRLKNNSLSDVLEGPFWNLPALKGLDLSGNFFRRIDPSLLANLPSLRKIDLSGNDIIKTDPATFSVNTLLEQVNLSHNTISFLHPATFNHLIVLYELDVSYNNLEEFIPSLPRSVEYLHMSHNRIDHIPMQPSPALDLPALRMLDLSGNGIQQIPPGAFRAIPQLKKLYIGTNFLQNLGENSINVLSRLEILDLQKNKLTQLHPNSLSGMTELKELNLHDNRLAVLKKEVFRNIPNLKKLIISKNSLKKILSEALENTRNIEVLDASYNALEDLPTSLHGLKKVHTLDLSNNQIQVLNSDTLNSLSVLAHLDMSYNSIRHLRKGAFHNLQHLKELQLDNNEIEIIEPNTIRFLPVLKTIKLNRNKLKEVPNSVFSNLPSLQVVELQENKLNSISNNAFHLVPHLLLLNISYNHLNGFEDAGLRGVSSLELLDISHNQLTRVAGNSLEKMDWLVELRMDDNQICAIHGSPFSGMPRLKVLTLRNNKMMSFPEKAVQKIKGNLAVLDIDGNPLVCSCNILWMRGWLQQTSSTGPRCVDGILLREMRLSKQDCSGDEQLSEMVAPGCEAELLSAPGTYGTSQVFSQWVDMKHNRTNNAHLGGSKNNIAPSPEESEYFYDEYVDYPYNETGTETNNNILSPSTPQPLSKVQTTKSSHYIAGDTPTIYAATKNKSKNPDVPKEVVNSPSSSGFTFFGLPLPNINLNNLLGGKGGSGRIDDKKLIQPPIAQRKTAIVNKPSRGTGRVNMNPPTDPEIQTGGFVPVLPGSGGFTPITNPNLPVTNVTGNIERQNLTWPVETSTMITNTAPTTTDAYLGDSHPIPLPTISSFTSTVTYNNSLMHLNGSISHMRTKLEINSSPASDVHTNKNIEVIGDNDDTNLGIKNITIIPERESHKLGIAQIEISPNKQSFEDIFKEVIENVSVPTIITSTDDTNVPVSTHQNIPVTQSVNDTTKDATEGIRNVATPLSALLIPGGQQPHYRPAGRPSITKVISPHRSSTAPLQSSFQVSEESIPMPHRDDEPINYIHSTTEKVDDDKSWYFMNYNNTDIRPYVGGINAHSFAIRIATSELRLLLITVFSCFFSYMW